MKNNIQNSEINFFNLSHSYENFFYNCCISLGLTFSSKANVFEMTDLPEIFQASLLYSSFEKRFYPIMVLVLSGVFLLVLFQFMIYLDNDPLKAFGTGLGLGGLIFGIIMVIIAYFSDKKELDQYPPNQII